MNRSFVNRRNIFDILPINLIFSYIIMTFILFFLAPYQWHLPSYTFLIFYMAAFLSVIYFSFRFGISGKIVRTTPINIGYIILGGGLLSLIMIFPSTYAYTNKWPWQILEALADQNAAYLDLGKVVAEGSVSRIPVILARMVTTPIIYPVIPLGIIYWKKISKTMKISVLIVILCNATFSIMRGTTRELADIAILCFSGFLILSARKNLSDVGRSKIAAKHIFKILTLGVMVLLFVIGSLTLRADARLGAQSQLCIGASGICADENSSIVAILPDSFYFLFATTSGYLSQGYYGLSISLEKDFVSSNGIGHSPALTNFARLLFGIDGWYESGYTYRNFQNGWSDEYQWSTAATWIANDVGFLGSLFVFAILIFFWGSSWKDATRGGSDKAVPYFCVINATLIYFPANLQFATSLDSYFNLIFWLIYWKASRPQ